MRDTDDITPLLSPKAARILSQYKWYDSFEAFRAAHPELTDQDIAEVTAEVKALPGAMAGGPRLGPLTGKKGKPGETGERADRGANAYQIKITLRGSKPPIWRRVVVPGHLTLGELHHVIQVAMGWENCHLHSFEIDEEVFTGLADGYEPENGEQDDEEYRLCDVVTREKKKFRYTYDFGDGWDHDLLVEKIIPAANNPPTMVCLKGKNRCPVEDSGGLWGYYDKLRIASDPSDPEHEYIKEWMGEIDPEEFDREGVNQELDRLKG